jgi:hypothetical protein
MSDISVAVGLIPRNIPFWGIGKKPHCRACREGVYPLDDVLGLVAGCKQLDMQHAAAQLVTEVPYDTA